MLLADTIRLDYTLTDGSVPPPRVERRGKGLPSMIDKRHGRFMEADME